MNERTNKSLNKLQNRTIIALNKRMAISVPLQNVDFIFLDRIFDTIRIGSNQKLLMNRFIDALDSLLFGLGFSGG